MPKIYSSEKLKEIINLHAMWIQKNPEGVQANLRGANLNLADLRGADLHRADLRGSIGTNTVIYDENTAFFALQCPEKGSYIAYKKAGNFIVELKIPAEALRSSATTRKCRASMAKVLSITDVNGESAGVEQIKSDYDSSFVYMVGQMISVPDFCEDRWYECSAGIHHFITRREAVLYK